MKEVKTCNYDIQSQLDKVTELKKELAILARIPVCNKIEMRRKTLLRRYIIDIQTAVIERLLSDNRNMDSSDIYEKHFREKTAKEFVQLLKDKSTSLDADTRLLFDKLVDEVAKEILER